MPEIISRKDARAKGLVRYFTGVPCFRGHVAERLVNCLHCLECTKIYRKNPNRPRWNREWKKRNRERLNALYRERYAKNPEKYRAKSRRVYQKNPERYRQYSRDYNKTAPGQYRQKARERTRQWALDNPERVARNVKVSKHRRRSRERSATGTFIANDLVTLFAAQVGRCIYCKDKLGQKYHVDHIVPLSKGGSNDPANLQLLCASCNLSKAARDPIVHAQSLGMLL